MRDADRIIGLLENANVGSPKLIVNRIRSSMVKSGEMLDLDDILQVLNIELLRIVPDDELVIRAANAGEPTVMNLIPAQRLLTAISPGAFLGIRFR